VTKKKRLLLIVLALYLAGYFVARSTGLMVHTTGYASTVDGSKVIAGHSMRPADVGAPMLHPGGALTVYLIGLAYFPVWPLEVFCWSIVQPSGSPYPYPLPPENEPTEAP
jgi:hypothetical protein